MFDQEKQQLKVLIDKQRHIGTLSPEYSRLVCQYNNILDSMVDRGLREPLPDELLLDHTLLSEKYSSMEEDWEKSQQASFDLFASKCPHIYMVEVKEVRSHTALAKVLREYKGERPWWLKWSRTIEIKYYVPWGFNSWYAEGERDLVFLDKDMISQGIIGRMPIVEQEGTWFAASYRRDRHFWPYDVQVVPSTLGNAEVYLIEMKIIEALITRQLIGRTVEPQTETLPQHAIYK